MKYLKTNLKILSRIDWIRLWDYYSSSKAKFPISNTELLENHMIFADKLEFVQLYLDLDYKVIVKKGVNYILLQKNFSSHETNNLTDFEVCNKQDKHNFFHFNRNRRLCHMPPIYTHIQYNNIEK